MGRTIPSLRISSVIEVKEWKAFRNSLDISDRKLFDQVFSDVGTRYYITTKLSKRRNYYYNALFLCVFADIYHRLFGLGQRAQIQDRQLDILIFLAGAFWIPMLLDFVETGRSNGEIRVK
jgi:hypothetical protein